MSSLERLTGNMRGMLYMGWGGWQCRNPTCRRSWPSELQGCRVEHTDGSRHGCRRRFRKLLPTLPAACSTDV